MKAVLLVVGLILLGIALSLAGTIIGLNLINSIFSIVVPLD